jgi:hypothetical protein
MPSARRFCTPGALKRTIDAAVNSMVDPFDVRTGENMVGDAVGTLLIIMLAFNLLPALTVFLFTHPTKHYQRRATDRSIYSELGHSESHK